MRPRTGRERLCNRTFTIAVADLEQAKRLAAKFEALGGSALAMALAQEA
jgi:hypothetical protein